MAIILYNTCLGVNLPDKFKDQGVEEIIVLRSFRCENPEQLFGIEDAFTAVK